jgi:hypothetical protein
MEVPSDGTPPDAGGELDAQPDETTRAKIAVAPALTRQRMDNSPRWMRGIAGAHAPISASTV